VQLLTVSAAAGRLATLPRWDTTDPPTTLGIPGAPSPVTRHLSIPPLTGLPVSDWQVLLRGRAASSYLKGVSPEGLQPVRDYLECAGSPSEPSLPSLRETASITLEVVRHRAGPAPDDRQDRRVRSSACIWVFSSLQTTMAFSHGVHVEPTTSRISASHSGSVENVNVSLFHGFKPQRRQMRAPSRS
jgi:hypothetical protein